MSNYIRLNTDVVTQWRLITVLLDIDFFHYHNDNTWREESRPMVWMLRNSPDKCVQVPQQLFWCPSTCYRVVGSEHSPFSQGGKTVSNCLFTLKSDQRRKWNGMFLVYKQESWLHFNGQSFYICSTCEATQNFHCLMCLHLQRFGFLLQSIMNYPLIVYYYHFGTSFS